MILSAIIGLILRENFNPFLQAEKRHKISVFLQIAIITAFLSFISSFIRVSVYDLFGGLILTLIIVNCPLGLFLSSKKDIKLMHSLILVSSLIILAFVVLYFGIIWVSPGNYYRYGETLTISPPLSYPLILSHNEHFLPRTRNFYSIFSIGLFLPFLQIQFSKVNLTFDRNDVIFESILETLRLESQFGIFIIYFMFNYMITLATMKFCLNYKDRLDIGIVLSKICRVTVLLVVISILVLSGPHVFLLYLIIRFGDESIYEIASILSILIGLTISALIMWVFFKYSYIQENNGHLAKRLCQIAITLVISPFLIFYMELVFPQKGDLIIDLCYFFLIIIIDIIIIIMTLLIIYHPLTLNQAKITEEGVLSIKKHYS